MLHNRAAKSKVKKHRNSGAVYAGCNANCVLAATSHDMVHNRTKKEGTESLAFLSSIERKVV